MAAGIQNVPGAGRSRDDDEEEQQSSGGASSGSQGSSSMPGNTTPPAGAQLGTTAPPPGGGGENAPNASSVTLGDPTPMGQVRQGGAFSGGQQSGVQTGAIGNVPTPDPNVNVDQSPNYMQQANEMWADIMAANQEAMQGAMQGTYADEARSARMFNTMDAQGGGAGVGGGFGAGQAQVRLGGIQQRQDVERQYHERELELKMAHLDRLIRQAEANKDRDLQRELQAEADKTALAIAQMQEGGGIDTTYEGGDDNNYTVGQTPGGLYQPQTAEGDAAPGWRGKGWEEDEQGNKTYTFDL